MSILVQMDFPFDGPFGEEMTKAMSDLAESIAKESGLLWKIWTVNDKTREAGGIYLFSDEESARHYIDMHSKRLKAAGIKTINAKLFTVDQELSALSNTPLGFLG